MADEDCEKAPECRDDVRMIKAEVFGNGHPGKSLLVRMERVEWKLSRIYAISIATLLGVGGLLVKFAFLWIESLLKS